MVRSLFRRKHRQKSGAHNTSVRQDRNGLYGQHPGAQPGRSAVAANGRGPYPRNDSTSSAAPILANGVPMSISWSTSDGAALAHSGSVPSSRGDDPGGWPATWNVVNHVGSNQAQAEEGQRGNRARQDEPPRYSELYPEHLFAFLNQLDGAESSECQSIDSLPSERGPQQQRHPAADLEMTVNPISSTRGNSFAPSQPRPSGSESPQFRRQPSMQVEMTVTPRSSFRQGGDGVPLRPGPLQTPGRTLHPPTRGRPSAVVRLD